MAEPHRGDQRTGVSPITHKRLGRQPASWPQLGRSPHAAQYSCSPSRGTSPLLRQSASGQQHSQPTSLHPSTSLQRFPPIPTRFLLPRKAPYFPGTHASPPARTAPASRPTAPAPTLDAHVHERRVGVHVALHAARPHLRHQLQCPAQLLLRPALADHGGVAARGGAGLGGEQAVGRGRGSMRRAEAAPRQCRGELQASGGPPPPAGELPDAATSPAQQPAATAPLPRAPAPSGLPGGSVYRAPATLQLQLELSSWAQQGTALTSWWCTASTGRASRPACAASQRSPAVARKAARPRRRMSPHCFLPTPQARRQQLPTEG